MSNYGLISITRFISYESVRLCNWLFFQLYLMLHVCVRRFDIIGTVQKILETKQGQSFTTATATSSTPNVMCRAKRDDAAGDPKVGRHRTRPLRRTPLGARSSQVAHISGPTCGFVASLEAGPGASVGTLQLGYPLLLCQDSRSYP